MCANKIWSISRYAASRQNYRTILAERQTTIFTFRRLIQNNNITTKKPPKSTIHLLLISLGVGGVIGTSYTGYKALTKSPESNLTEQKLPTIIDRLPDDIKITKKFYNPKDANNLDLILFQFQTCPFCCKVRAFLDSQGLSYSIVEVDAVLRQSLKWSTYKKVPMLLVRRSDGKYIQLTDSSMIISTLASYAANPVQTDINELANYYPCISYVDEDGRKHSDIMNKYFLMYQESKNIPTDLTQDKIIDERKWRAWADDHLVHLISPNVYRNSREALETFQWFSDIGEWDIHFPNWERNLMVYVGATAMWAISKRLKKRHGLSDDVRINLYDACDKWIDELKKKQTKFHGGNKPNLADLTIFGVLNSMEGCQAFLDCLKNTNIGPWFYAMKEYVHRNKAPILTAQNQQLELVQYS